MSKPTFYKYVNIGAISLSDYELPRKVRYKSRVKVKDKIYKNKIYKQQKFLVRKKF